MFKDIFTSDSSWDEKVLLSLLLALTLLVAVLLIGLAYILVDSINLESTNVTITTVEKKKVVPAHSTSHVVMVGRVPVTQTTWRPQSYKIYFEINDEIHSTSISKSNFEKVRLGQNITVEYARGRLSGSVHPTAFKLN